MRNMLFEICELCEYKFKQVDRKWLENYHHFILCDICQYYFIKKHPDNIDLAIEEVIEKRKLHSPAVVDCIRDKKIYCK